MDAVRQKVDAVVSAGLCGAVVPDLRVGDIVVATEVNGQPADLLRCGGTYRLAKVASADRVIGSAAERRQVAAGGVQAVDMESAAVLEQARRLGVPFYCVRVVSDKAGEDWTLDLNAARGEDGAFRLGRILRQAAARPARVVPELLRLRRNSALAARRLGDFFAECNF
jgi:nucleoside phosphorylase